MAWKVVRDEAEWSKATPLARDGLLRFRARLETDPFAVVARGQFPNARLTRLKP